jgi:K+-transporting ATPase ATPase C chain
MLNDLKPGIVLFTVFTLLTGIIYPLLVTILAQGIFPVQANGSLLKNAQGQIIGSGLIGQPFSNPYYFWGRPSATSPYPYNAAASSGSNLGPTNPALADAVKARIDALKKADPVNHLKIPVDLVTSSASGLDPHISLAAAEYQIHRVAKVRHLSEDQVRQLVHQHAEGRQWRLFGEARINVLKLNLALDALNTEIRPE